jgi:hypothetical protein
MCASINSGADVNARTKVGRTVRDYATDAGVQKALQSGILFIASLLYSLWDELSFMSTNPPQICLNR